ncbi:MAG: hypothetical protein H6822_00215 [Planctomycetaceae bacterium]|nr:hypothetical protein [Planctomycetales bacterium]MCB9920569.1 hypothetical protein [Planctomycetaceae bacterium]
MINSDDPRLTAYVLGELGDAERAVIAEAIAASPELQVEVASIEQSISLLHDSFQTETPESLTDQQRQAIQDTSAHSSVEVAWRTPGGGYWRRHGFAIAVGSLTALVLVGLLLPSIQYSRSPLSRAVAIDPSAQATPSSSPMNGVLTEPLDEHMSYRSLPASLRSELSELNDRAVTGDVERWDEATPHNEIQMNQITLDPLGRNEGLHHPDVAEMEVAELDIKGFDVGFGFDERPGRVLSSATVAGAQGSASSSPVDAIQQAAPIDGVPAIQLADPTQAERLRESIEQGRLTGGKGLRADMSSVRVDPQSREGRVSPPNPEPRTTPERLRGVIGDVSAEQELSPDLLITEVDAIHNRRSEDLAAGPATTRVAESELTESSVINGRAKDAIPETNIRRRELAVTREAMERREQISQQGLVTDSHELGELHAVAPQQTWRRAQATPNASRLIIGDKDELLMEGMQANVMVDGFRARVLLDLYYFNNRGRQLEGNFKLRLPDDASLYYFAFGESAYEYRPQVDQLASKGFLNGELVRAAGLSPKGILEAREGSWSKVKEARIVPREKAAHAYSETVRRRVDPALVEWSGAGMFNARVFPLMPNKLHRIVVGYDVNLQQVGDDLVYRLDMPADAGQCTVDLNVSALPGTTADIQPTTRPFVSSGRAYYHFDQVNDNSITVRFAGTGPVLLKGKDPQAGDFFAARVTPKLDAGQTQSGAERATFMVDTSLSSRPDKFNVWLNLMEATLTKNRDTLKSFSVLFFNIDSHWWKEAEVDNTPENVDSLMKYCYSLSLEGATDLRQALREASSPSWAAKSEDKAAPRDLFLLSDGAVTWGEMNVHQLRSSIAAEQTLFAYTTGMTGTSTATLEHLARETGGAVFSIVNEDEITAAATAHRSRPWNLLDVTMAGGSDLLVAGRPRHIYPGQSLLIVGRGEPDAKAMLKVSRGDEVTQLSVAFERIVESELAARAYGQLAVGQLEDLGSSLEDVSVAYARHFRVTGQTCSLLMLDSEADYQRFNIKPEDDLFVVRSTPPADLITKKLDELAGKLSDAKAGVVEWLDKLQNTAGFQFQLPTALRLVIERLPQEAFDVAPPRLVCKSHVSGELPKEFLRQLDSGKLDYDTITARAKLNYDAYGAADGLRTLSSLIEQNPGDPVLTRDVAYSAIEWGLGGQVFPLLERVASMRPYEPQSYIAMAQCLADIDRADLAMVYYEVTLNARWHDRYKDIRDIAGVEYLRLLRRIDRGELSSHAPEYAKARLESLVKQTQINEADLVITMMWNTNRTDVDLHVLEPTGEECFYSHPTTRIGGHVTRDVTEGLGPEMYTLPKAKTGSYKIMANYFGNDANRTQVRSKVYVTVYRDFGDKYEKVEKKTIVLSDQKEKRELTTITIK